MQFNFFPIKAEMCETFDKRVASLQKKLLKAFDLAVACRAHPIDEGTLEHIHLQLTDIFSDESKKLQTMYIEMMNKVSKVVENHIV